MKKKAIVAALLLFVVGFGAFAEMGMYLKGALGYGYRSTEWDHTQTISTSYGGSTSQIMTYDMAANLFEIIPTFGIEPWQGNSNAFLRGLSFEFSVDVGFGKAALEYNGVGSGGDETAIVISPRVMAVYTYRAKMFAPYFGVGVSVPIAIVSAFDDRPYTYSQEGVGYTYNYEMESFKVGFNANLMAGIGFQITESIMPVIEVDLGFGTGMRFDGRVGVVYRLGI